MGSNCLLQVINNHITSAILACFILFKLKTVKPYALSGDNGILFVIKNNDLNLSLMAVFPVMKKNQYS